MASSDSWMKEFTEASKLADEIDSMISTKNDLPSSGPETQRHLSAIRRKITILKTRLETLQSLPNKPNITKREIKRRQDMQNNMISRATEMATTLNMNSLVIRERLLGSDSKRPDIMNQTADLDNQGIISLQKQVMKEQDEDLGQLEETVVSTKHIAFAINEELDLHSTYAFQVFIVVQVHFDNHVNTTNTRLLLLQRKLAILNRKTKGGCTYLCLLVLVIVILVVVVLFLIRYL
ncbi:hypothetical protein Leryth_016883 [Lithospermum erythrorhizon]|nr:hypothetical protein Leryth_016883 [Lithospermum erythrorhizon]